MRVVEGVVRDCVRDVVRTTIKGYCDEFQTVYDSMTTPPDADVAAAQNTMVQSLVDGGVWDKLDVFYLFAVHTNDDGEALKNWISPGTHDATLVNAPTFTAFEGFTGDGATCYINTNYNPSTDAVNLSLNDASFGLYYRTTVDDGKTKLNGTWSTDANGGGASRAQLTNVSGGINSGTSAGGTITAPAGAFKIVSRLSATTQKIYLNKSEQSFSVNSETIPDQDVLILALHQAGGSPYYYDTSQFSCGFLSGGLTQTDVDTITDAVETYMTSNGKGL
jgi:hypothetical protein